jgi:excisionase family DNA binding protein
MTTTDVAAKLNFTAKTVRRWCEQGVFPGARQWPHPGRGHWRIPTDDVEALLREKTTREPVSNDRIDAAMDAALAALGARS